MYIYQILSIYQDFYYVISILTNTYNLLILDFWYLANILTSSNNTLKIKLCYLTNIMINTNDKVNDFIKKNLITFN